MNIPKELILDRINNFWGYGSFEASTWFVGMEEGLGVIDADQLEERFQVAYGKPTVDMRIGMDHLVGHMALFKPGARIQGTWNYPISLYLYLKNRKIPDKEDVRNYQIKILGDSTRKDSATIELMPLPSRNTHESSWLYKGCGIPECESRKLYMDRYRPERIDKLKKLITQYHPKRVIFYSVGYLEYWRMIVGENLEQITRQMYFAQNNKTSFYVIPQGRSFGMSKQRVYDFAQKVLNRETA